MDWDLLTVDLKRYEYEISSTGHLSNNAPSGYHEDCLIVLALANQGRWQAGNVGMMTWLARCRQAAMGEEGKRWDERVVAG